MWRIIFQFLTFEHSPLRKQLFRTIWDTTVYVVLLIVAHQFDTIVADTVHYSPVCQSLPCYRSSISKSGVVKWSDGTCFSHEITTFQWHKSLRIEEWWLIPLPFITFCAFGTQCCLCIWTILSLCISPYLIFYLPSMGKHCMLIPLSSNFYWTFLILP